MTWHQGLAGGLLLLTALPAPPASRPAEVILTLRLAGDQRQFHTGELIPIELEYASAVRKRFYVEDVGDRDHSNDEYRVEPNRGVSDPLLDFLAVGSRWDYGSGIGPLGERPQVSKRALNDWFRFDEPGIYRISVLSHSVRQGDAVVPVESNTIALEILNRDPAWEAAQVASQTARIDGRPGDDVSSACRALQVLGTEAAVDAMIRRFDMVECQTEFVRGLYAAPDRQYVVRQMASWIAAPDQSVSQYYVRTLAILSVYLEHPELRPAKRELIDAAIERFGAAAIAARAHKAPRARAVTVMSAFEAARPGTGRDALRAEVIASFADLPTDRQQMVLDNPYLWPSLSSPAMLPVLRKLADSTASASGYAPGTLSDLALRRWWQLAPADARPTMLERIAHPGSADTIETLGALPDDTLPSLDAALASNLPDADDEDADLKLALFERYATGAVAGAALQAFEAAVAADNCGAASPLVAYLTRVDAAQGRNAIGRVRAMPKCRTFLWLGLKHYRMSQPIEAAAIDGLLDSDAEAASFAAQLLGLRGTAASRQPLLEAFERLHAAWKDRDRALEFQRGPVTAEAMNGIRTENALMDALAFGAGWHATSADLEYVRQLCLTDQCRQQTTYRIEAADRTEIRISYASGDSAHFNLAYYYDLNSFAALENRLRQYQKGTTFTLELGQLDPAVAKAVRTRIGEMAKRLGLVVR